MSFFKGEASTLFFMISGALLLQRERSSSIKASLQRSLNLIIPLAVWSLIYFCKDYILHNRIFDVVSLLNSPACYHLWFIYVMIGVYIFLPVIKMFFDGLVRNESLTAYFFFSFMVVSLLYSLGAKATVNLFGFDKILCYPIYFLWGASLASFHPVGFLEQDLSICRWGSLF